MKKYTGKKVKYFLLYFIPLIVLFGAAFGVLYYSDIRAERKIFEGREHHMLAMQVDMIAQEFQSIVSDLHFLNQNHELLDMIEGKNNEARMHLAYEFLSFSSMKKIYDQVRFLDATGMETVRVNFNKGNPSVVPEHKLQNKGKRYYFRDVFKLDRGEVFVSPFDLNVERGKVEQPLKPMLRFGTPTFDRKGNKKGIVLLNYFGSHLLGKFSKILHDAVGEVMLINSDGYWLKGANPEDEWGFMFEDRKGKTIGSTYPDSWKNILSSDSGQFYSNGDLFTFETVYPLLEGMKSSSGSGEVFTASQGDLKAKEYYWKIVSRVPRNVMIAGPRNFLRSSAPVMIFITLILALLSGIISRTRFIREKAEMELAEARVQVVESAHKAGMADIATGVLHNIGNVLNSANASSEEIRNVVTASEVESFIKANELLHDHMDNLSEFLTSDERGRKLPEFYVKLSTVWQEENEKIGKNIGRVEEKIRTMKGIVETQQEYARTEFHAEKEDIPKIIGDVLKIQKDLIDTSGVRITNKLKEAQRCRVQKNKVVHVLINLIKNSIEAMKGNDLLNKTKELTIETGQIDEQHDYVRIIDNGCGIPQENLIKIFNHGFTTKEKGHGFGLHASANAMTEMGGSIAAESDGENKGASFTVTLPVQEESAESV